MACNFEFVRCDTVTLSPKQIIFIIKIQDRIIFSLSISFVSDESSDALMFSSTNPKRMKFYTIENVFVFDITLFRIFCFVHLVGTIQHGGQDDMLSGSRSRGNVHVCM